MKSTQSGTEVPTLTIIAISRPLRTLQVGRGSALTACSPVQGSTRLGSETYFEIKRIFSPKRALFAYYRNFYVHYFCKHIS